MPQSGSYARGGEEAGSLALDAFGPSSGKGDLYRIKKHLRLCLL